MSFFIFRRAKSKSKSKSTSKSKSKSKPKSKTNSKIKNSPKPNASKPIKNKKSKQKALQPKSDKIKNGKTKNNKKNNNKMNPMISSKSKSKSKLKSNSVSNGIKKDNKKNKNKNKPKPKPKSKSVAKNDKNKNKPKPKPKSKSVVKNDKNKNKKKSKLSPKPKANITNNNKNENKKKQINDTNNNNEQSPNVWGISLKKRKRNISLYSNNSNDSNNLSPINQKRVKTPTSKNDNDNMYKVGDFVLLSNDREGIIGYKGILHDKESNIIYYGIELLGGSVGDSDGTYSGKRYFQTLPDRAIFVQIDEIRRMMLGKDYKTSHRLNRRQSLQHRRHSAVSNQKQSDFELAIFNVTNEIEAKCDKLDGIIENEQYLDRDRNKKINMITNDNDNDISTIKGKKSKNKSIKLNTLKSKYEENAKNIDIERNKKLNTMKKRESFCKIKLDLNVKSAAISGFENKLKNDKKQKYKNNKQNKLIKWLKNENDAVNIYYIEIMKELEFLTYTKYNQFYSNLMKSQNSTNKKRKGKRNRNLNKNDDDIKEEEKEKEKENNNDDIIDYDMFNMTNSNIIFLLSSSQCDVLENVICKTLISISTLRVIDICNCGVDDIFITKICSNLILNNNKSKIWCLNLQSNPIGNNGILSLCSLIELNNKYLTHIKLQNNRKDISTDICDKLCSSLQINEYIKVFEFEFRHFQYKDKCTKILSKNNENARKVLVLRSKQLN